MSHDVVSLPPGAPSSAPPTAESKPAGRRWNPAAAPVDDEGSLPSVIVDFGEEVEELVAALRDGSPEDNMLIPPLLTLGEAALLIPEIP